MSNLQSDINYSEYVGNDFKGLIINQSPLSIWLNQSHEPLDLLASNATMIKVDEKTRAGTARIDLENDEAESLEIFVKEYKPRKHFRLVKLLIGHSRAPKVWNIACHLIHHGIPIPKPYAYFVYHDGDYNGISYYCCELLKDCKMLADIAYYDETLYAKLRQSDFFDRVMDSITKIHKLGISHGDLKWTNILVDEHTLDFWFIDLDACVLHRRYKLDHFASRDISRFFVAAVEANEEEPFLKSILDLYAQRNEISLDKLKTIIKPRVHRLLKRKKLTCSYLEH